MKTRSGRFFVAMLLAGCATTSVSKGPTKEWAQLTGWLEGSWLANTGNGPPVKVSYRLISSDSALVESFVPASGRETMTVIHPDGDDVVLVHYCAQENQPRLRLKERRGDELVFRLADVTNRHPDSSVMIEKRIKKVGETVEETEVYEAPGGARDVTVWTYRRVK